MKIKSDMWQVTPGSDKWQVTGDRKRHSPPATRHSVSCHPSRVTRHPQQGVALIITLILLSVVLFMALTFMALSRRERGAVTTLTDTAGARYAADAALANAEAQIIANVLATTNPYSFGLLVSTNAGLTNWLNFLPDNMTNLYVLPRAPVLVSSNEPFVGRYYLDLNRNGRFDTNGLSPVISPDPSNPYYDLNGNPVNTSVNILSNYMVGDPEWIGVLERPDAPYGPNNKFIARYAFIAVPVGNTLDLNAIYNQVNDENNADKTVNPLVAGNLDGYFRNQGVGSWELNLAAFLADLNTNEWGQVIGNAINGNSGFYYYQFPLGTASDNRGRAFEDARGLLAYRYNYTYTSLASVQNLYGLNAADDFKLDNIDGYSDGALQTGFPLPGDFSSPRQNDDPTLLWAGANNTNHYFTHQELFDPTETQNGVTFPTLGFTDRLLQAGTNAGIFSPGTNVSTYNRYTFYRLLSQLGTDSALEPGKMNLNYDNIDPTNGVANATNFMAWRPLVFFTNAADRLLRTYTAQWRASNPTNFATTFYAVYDFTPITDPDQWTNYPAFGIGNIPVLVSNQFVYSPAVNRLLQLAANLYDATTTNRYPTVFRPTFWVTNLYGYLDVYINGYQQVVLTVNPPETDPQLNVPVDLSGLLVGASTNNYPVTGVNVYGVPWIVGVKKGFPNFNEFAMQDIVQVTRKLQVIRSVTNVPPQSPEYQTNQMYIFGITNSLALECWNSYTNDYSNTVKIVVKNHLLMTLTNAAPGTFSFTSNYFMFVSTNIILWPGSHWGYNSLDQQNSTPFVIPLETNAVFLPTSVYRFGLQTFVPATDTALTLWETNANLTQLPQFGLTTSNALQFFILDGTNIIDYVNLNGPISRRSINTELNNPDRYDPRGLWQTNLQGVYNQLDLSRGLFNPNAVPTEDGGAWVPPAGVAGVSTPPQDEAYFNAMFTAGNRAVAPVMAGYSSAAEQNLSFGTQAPYTPTRTMYEYITWQANDPLVHHLVSDLRYSGISYNAGGDSLHTGITNSDHAPVLYLPNIRNVNDRYAPWAKNGHPLADADDNGFNLAYKDPLVTQSDCWDFPTNKYPSVGWMGRVHRGTPWQTVYLKSSNILAYANFSSPVSPVGGINTWAEWTGDTQLANGQYFDAINTAPLRDRLLFDLFTAAFNDNASRGALPVNIGATTNASSVAAWSALFSGMVVLTNTTISPNELKPPSYNYLIIDPAGPYDNSAPPPLLKMLAGINAVRAGLVHADGLAGTFEHVGDILSVPQFSEQSPFLHLSNFVASANAWVEDLAQKKYAISDETYEWLPQQTMALLRCSSSPRYVIYCYGQALKPAPNAVVTGGSLFGMVTNYQVVSEVATRAVVRFNSMVTNVVTFNVTIPTNSFVPVTNWFSVPVVTNNSVVIEDFNPLPPD